VVYVWKLKWKQSGTYQIKMLVSLVADCKAITATATIATLALSNPQVSRLERCFDFDICICLDGVLARQTGRCAKEACVGGRIEWCGSASFCQQ